MPTKKRKPATFMQDTDIPDKLQQLQHRLNETRTANEGALSLSDLINQAIWELLLKHGIK